MVEIKKRQQKQNRQNLERGYVTLISAIIISATLMMILLDQSGGGFWTRFGVLNHEKKDVSMTLAFSCAEISRLKIAEAAAVVAGEDYDGDYDGNETIQLSDGGCEIKNIKRGGEEIIFQTSATYGKTQGNARTDLEITINSENFALVKYLLQ